MTKIMQTLSVAALAACASLSLSSCGGSSSKALATLPSLDDTTIAGQGTGDLADDQIRMTSLECTATSTGSTIETGMVDFTMTSANGDWSASSAEYRYDSSTGVITIYAGTVADSSGTSTLSYSDIALRISLDMNMTDIGSIAEVTTQYSGYQSAASVTVTGEDVVDDDGEFDSAGNSATVTILGQSIIIAKNGN